MLIEGIGVSRQVRLLIGCTLLVRGGCYSVLHGCLTRYISVGVSERDDICTDPVNVFVLCYCPVEHQWEE